MTERAEKESWTLVGRMPPCICCGVEVRYTQMCTFCGTCEDCFLACKQCRGNEVCCCVIDSEYGPFCGPDPWIHRRTAKSILEMKEEEDDDSK
jgi:hypothetical protein